MQYALAFAGGMITGAVLWHYFIAWLLRQGE